MNKEYLSQVEHCFFSEDYLVLESVLQRLKKIPVV